MRIAVRQAAMLIILCLLVVMHAGQGMAVEPAGELDQTQPHAGAQTAGQLTAREAYAKWQAENGRPIVLDVRTPEEFLYVGHAEMAWNVPLAAQSYVWDAAKGRYPMRLLPDFVSRVEKIAKPDDTLLVMCRAGNRSAQAVELLTQAGFRNVYDITDGMEGDLVTDRASVFFGKRMVNGWKNSGLPWTYAADPKRMILPPPEISDQKSEIRSLPPDH
jgi:rhodanese-related sulfurtransferase